MEEKKGMKEMKENSMIFLKDTDLKILDGIRSAVDKIALPKFWSGDHSRPKLPDDNDIFRSIAEKRAYGAAQSRLVEAMINDGAMGRAFAGFNVMLAIELKEKEIIDQYWPEIKVIRFKKKVGEILETAKVIAGIGREFGSFAEYLERVGKPRKIEQAEDIEPFWREFDRLLAALKARKLPIISNEITLLHFLEAHLQLDCIKPDIVVMRVMTNTGMVPAKRKDKHRLAVMKIQEYCLLRKIRPQTVDRYLLAFGGQTSAKAFVKKSYCEDDGRCGSSDCPLGKARLCPTWCGYKLSATSQG